MIISLNSSEKELINESKKGNKQAFQELVFRNENRIQGWIKSFTKKPEIVQDIFQISCIKAWKYVSSFRGDCKFSSWVCNIARNSYYDLYRAKQRKPEVSLDEIMAKQTEVGGAFELHCLGSEDHPRNKNQDSDYYLNEIDKRLKKGLPKMHREPLMMFLREGLEYTEIAKKLNCPVGTVMSRIFYGRKKARKLLKNLKNELAAE